MTSSLTNDASSSGTAQQTLSIHLSPLKRKRSVDRDSLPDDIPEIPWRKTVTTTSDGDHSPRSKRLVGQMQGMKLGDDSEVAIVEGDVDMEIELPTHKRRRSSVVTIGSPQRSAEKVKKTVAVQGAVTCETGSKRLRSPPPDGLRATVESGEPVKVNASKPNEDLEEEDPDDFGIAYIPTAAQRDQRRQTRFQQIKDYKSRESKEARQKRSEQRRRRRSASLYEQSQSAGENSEERRDKKVVHFLI